MKINLFFLKQTLNQFNQEIEIVRVEVPLSKSDYATITVELKPETKHKYNNENKLNYYKPHYESIESRNRNS